jgi:hypothetical protein
MASLNNTPGPLVVLGRDLARRWVGDAPPRLPALIRRDEHGQFIAITCVCGHANELVPNDDDYWQQVYRSVGVDHSGTPGACQGCGMKYHPIIMGYADDPIWYRRPELCNDKGQWLPHVRAAIAASLDATMALPDGGDSTT